MKSYKDLEIYTTSFKIALEIRNLTISLPNPDKYEVGSQIRRSSQSIKDNIVEGYGRRKYKADFIKFLIYSHASLLEATSQAEFLAEVYNNGEWRDISERLDKLGAKIYNFINYVDKNWKV